jgi:hypothetical protein
MKKTVLLIIGAIGARFAYKYFTKTKPKAKIDLESKTI